MEREISTLVAVQTAPGLPVTRGAGLLDSIDCPLPENHCDDRGVQSMGENLGTPPQKVSPSSSTKQTTMKQIMRIVDVVE